MPRKYVLVPILGPPPNRGKHQLRRQRNVPHTCNPHHHTAHQPIISVIFTSNMKQNHFSSWGMVGGWNPGEITTCITTPRPQHTQGAGVLDDGRHPDRPQPERTRVWMVLSFAHIHRHHIAHAYEHAHTRPTQAQALTHSFTHSLTQIHIESTSTHRRNTGTTQHRTPQPKAHTS